MKFIADNHHKNEIDTLDNNFYVSEIEKIIMKKI